MGKSKISSLFAYSKHFLLKKYVVFLPFEHLVFSTFDGTNSTNQDFIVIIFYVMCTLPNF